MADWAPGDLALCVEGGPGRTSVARIGGEWRRESLVGEVRSGAIYTVLKVKNFPDADPPVLGLKFVEVPGPWLASRFRKIRPHAPDAEDAETIRLLNGQPATEDA